MSNIKEERDDMPGDIRYIKFSGDYDKFDECKESTNSISIHKGILKNITKKWGVPKEEDSEDNADLLKIYEWNRKAWYLLIISLSDMPFGLVSKCN